ncbi:MAG: hypothetical protein AAF754_19260 [Pseudomonadota bacterium]
MKRETQIIPNEYLPTLVKDNDSQRFQLDLSICLRSFVTLQLPGSTLLGADTTIEIAKSKVSEGQIKTRFAKPAVQRAGSMRSVALGRTRRGQRHLLALRGRLNKAQQLEGLGLFR